MSREFLLFRIIKGTFLVFLLLISSSSSFADIYKCKGVSGKIIYQATPCKGKILQPKIKTTKKTPSKDRSEQCRSSCDSQHLICVSNLKDGTWNSDGGLELCKEETKACNISCIDSFKGKLAKLSAEYKRSIYEIDKKYEKKKRTRKAKKV